MSLTDANLFGTERQADLWSRFSVPWGEWLQRVQARLVCDVPRVSFPVVWVLLVAENWLEFSFLDKFIQLHF